MHLCNVHCKCVRTYACVYVCVYVCIFMCVAQVLCRYCHIHIQCILTDCIILHRNLERAGLTEFPNITGATKLRKL